MGWGDVRICARAGESASSGESGVFGGFGFDSDSDSELFLVLVLVFSGFLCLDQRHLNFDFFGG